MDISAILSQLNVAESAPSGAKAPESGGGFAAILAMLAETAAGGQGAGAASGWSAPDLGAESYPSLGLGLAVSDGSDAPVSDADELPSCDVAGTSVQQAAAFAGVAVPSMSAIEPVKADASMATAEAGEAVARSVGHAVGGTVGPVAWEALQGEPTPKSPVEATPEESLPEGSKAGVTHSRPKADPGQVDVAPSEARPSGGSVELESFSIGQRPSVLDAGGEPSEPATAVPASAPDGDTVAETGAVPVEPETVDTARSESRLGASSWHRGEASEARSVAARSHARVVKTPARADGVEPVRPVSGSAADDGSDSDTAKAVRADRTSIDEPGGVTEAKSAPQSVPSARQWASELHAAVVRRAASVTAPEAPQPKAIGPEPVSNAGVEAKAHVQDAAALDADGASQDGDGALNPGGSRGSGHAMSVRPDEVRPASIETEFSAKVEAASRNEAGASVHAPPSPAPRVAVTPAPVQVIERSAPVDLGDFVVRHVRLSSSDGTQTWTVRLVPESLGELRVEVSSVDSQVSVRLLTPSGEVRDRLEGQIHRLHEALAREGIEVTRVVVASQSSAGPQLMANDANGQGGRGHPSPQPGSQGHASHADRGWNSGGGSSPRDGHAPQRRPRSAFDVWA